MKWPQPKFDKKSFPVTDEESLTIQGGSIEVIGWLAIWRPDENIYLAGGAYPGENFKQTINKELTDAITATLQIDLGLEPQRYRQELFQLIKSVGSGRVQSPARKEIETPPPKTATTIDLTDDLVYDPKTITIGVGTTVTWENVGSVGHTVTAYEDQVPNGAEYFASGGFDSEQAARIAYEPGDTDAGDIPGGESWKHIFETPGTYEYFSTLMNPPAWSAPLRSRKGNTRAHIDFWRPTLSCTGRSYSCHLLPRRQGLEHIFSTQRWPGVGRGCGRVVYEVLPTMRSSAVRGPRG